MARSAGIPGLAVALAAGGSYLLYAGLGNIPVLEGLRALLRGELPAPRPPAPAEIPEALQFSNNVIAGNAVPAPPSNLAEKIVDVTMDHVGVPYKLGGNDPSGWDCSGMVTWVLRTCGVGGLPSARPTALQYLTWSGATTVPRDQCQPGDLACWAGHIGIATNQNNMVNAPTFGVPTRVQKIYAGVTIRRINATVAAGGTPAPVRTV